MPSAPALSVLDLSPVPSGTTAAGALRNTLDLARYADARGLARYWLAEHHNAAGLASSAPEVVIAAVAAVTSRIRVGSGGIMLPNHSALKVAETFRALHALHPGRIDLGVGRAAGTDNKTALALRRSREHLGADGFPEQLGELLALLTTDPDPLVRFGPLKAVPTGVEPPELYLLGASEESASAAARLGLGYAYAHHFDPNGAEVALLRYRAEFLPCRRLRASPHAIVAVAVACGESDAHADELASSSDLSWVRFGQGLRDLPLPSVEEARAYAFDVEEEQIRRANRARVIVGGTERVGEALRALVSRTKADEIMVTANLHDHEERKRSYDRILTALECRGSAAGREITR